MAQASISSFQVGFIAVSTLLFVVCNISKIIFIRETVFYLKPLGIFLFYCWLLTVYRSIYFLRQSINFDTLSDELEK